MATTTSAVERYARTLELPYKPFPKQQEFHRCPAKYRLFGGAAGPGKSMALLMEAVMQANEVAGADTILLRRTFPELETSLINQFRKHVPQELYRSWNDSKHIITWWNNSVTRFGYTASDKDVYQWQGAEFLFIGIDELTLFTLGQWQFLTSRNRCPVAGSFANMAGATNPGNIGHAWVKALWIDKKPAPFMENPQEYDPADYEFIKARVWDNPIYAADESYLKKLRGLPEHWRKAFLEGDWDTFAGQYFDIFDPMRHVQRPEDMEIQTWWPKWISIDWGFDHPSAAYWHTTSPDGKHFTYREFVQNHISPRMVAQAIVERSANEKIQQIFLSPDAYAKRTSESTIAEQLGEVLRANGYPEPAPADDDRVGGWMLMYQLLETDKWIIGENCTELIACLPTLVRDEKKVEDIAKMAGDDTADSVRYGLKSRLSPGKMPTDLLVDERLKRAKITDPTSHMIFRMKFTEEANRQAQPVHFARHR